GNEEGRPEGHLLRNRGQRSVSLAGNGRPRIEGRRELGRTAEQGHVRLSRIASVSRRDQEAPHRALELREDRYSREDRHPLHLPEEQWSAESVRGLCRGFAERSCARAARSEHVVE